MRMLRIAEPSEDAPDGGWINIDEICYMHVSSTQTFGVQPKIILSGCTVTVELDVYNRIKELLADNFVE